jgi:Na+-transporting methylmalonyl-CoA/oxaloacetate decarboxylase beta subunit
MVHHGYHPLLNVIMNTKLYFSIKNTSEPLERIPIKIDAIYPNVINHDFSKKRLCRVPITI